MMKKKGMISAGVLCLTLVCTMAAGCGKKEESGDTETKSVASAEELEMLEGTLVKFTGGEIEIDDGKEEYTFDLSQASIDTKKMRSGDDLVVSYKGEIDGTDTSNVQVVSVADNGNENESKNEKEAVGSLVDITMNTITIRQNDGTELTFNSNNCEHDFKNGIREGNWVVITYIGEIQGTDTQNIAVIKITDDDENAVKKAKKEMKITTADETVYATAGVHIRESYSTDSKVVGSLAKGDSIKRTGICANGWSRVSYKDADAYVYGDYLTTTKPKADAPAAKTDGSDPKTPQKGDEAAPVKSQPAESEPEESEPEESEPEDSEPAESEPEKSEPEDSEPAESEPEDSQPEESQPQEKKQATGTVEDASMNTLTVQVDGQNYTVNISDAQHEYANGIQTGNKVTITYIGDLSDSDVQIVKVTDSDPNTAASDAVYTGKITDATTNTITIQTNDGATMTFDKSEADDEVGDLEVGISVSIVADASASSSDETIMTAKKIKTGE